MAMRAPNSLSAEIEFGTVTWFVYAGISCFLVLFAGIMSGLTLGLMSLGLVELEILQRSGTPLEKKQAGFHFILLIHNYWVNKDWIFMNFISVSRFVRVIWAWFEMGLNRMYWIRWNWCVFDWLIHLVFVVILEGFLNFWTLWNGYSVWDWSSRETIVDWLINDQNYNYVREDYCSFDGFYFSGMVWIFIEFFMIHVNEDCFLMKFISLSIFVWVIWARIQNGMYWMILNWCVFDWLIWLIGIHLWYGKVVFVVI